MFASNSNCDCEGKRQVDRLIENSSATPNSDQFELTDSLFQSLSNNILSCDIHLVDFTVFNTTEQNTFLFHANIRSLQKNFDSLLDLFNIFTTYPGICITETRIKGTPHMNIKIPNYKLIYFNSPTNAGGVAIYVSKNFKILSIDQQELQIQSCEDLWLLVSLRNSPVIFTIEVVYRHPHSDLKEFLDSLNDKLINLNPAKKTYFLLGDMNIDISSNVHTTSKDNYFKMIESNGALSIITKPTRITVTSQTGPHLNKRS